MPGTLYWCCANTDWISFILASRGRSDGYQDHGLEITYYASPQTCIRFGEVGIFVDRVTDDYYVITQ